MARFTLIVMDRLLDSIEAYADYISHVGVKADEVDYKLAKSYLPLLESMDSLGYGIAVVVDYCRNDYFFVSRRFNSLFGFNSPSCETKQQEWFRTRVHPEDYVVNIARIKGREHIEQLAPEERKNYKLVHDLRMLNEDNKWIRLLIQDSVLELDRKGAVWLVMKVFDLAPNQDLETPGRSVLYNFKTNKAVFTCIGEKQPACKISSREKEVLSLMAQGLLSKQIADALFISAHTVNNHRKNILKKLEVNNTAQAIKQASKLKLI